MRIVKRVKAFVQYWRRNDWGISMGGCHTTVPQPHRDANLSGVPQLADVVQVENEKGPVMQCSVRLTTSHRLFLIV